MYIDVVTISLLKMNVFIRHSYIYVPPLIIYVVTFYMSVHNPMTSWAHNSRSSAIRVITELVMLPDEVVSMIEENVLY